MVKRGGASVAAITVTTLPGFHVNSDKPKDEFLIPLRLTWEPSTLEAGRVAYPAAEMVDVGSDHLSVFTGTFTLKTEVKAPPSASPGAVVLQGKLHYQACNNRMCFRPETLDIKVPVVVE